MISEVSIIYRIVLLFNSKSVSRIDLDTYDTPKMI